MNKENHLKKETILLLDFFERDYAFENEVIWGVEFSEGEYNFRINLGDDRLEEESSRAEILVNNLIDLDKPAEEINEKDGLKKKGIFRFFRFKRTKREKDIVTSSIQEELSVKEEFKGEESSDKVREEQEEFIQETRVEEIEPKEKVVDEVKQEKIIQEYEAEFTEEVKEVESIEVKGEESVLLDELPVDGSAETEFSISEPSSLESFLIRPDEPAEMHKTGEEEDPEKLQKLEEEHKSEKKEKKIKKTHQKLATKKEENVSRQESKKTKKRKPLPSDLIREFSLESFPEVEKLFPDSNPLKRDAVKDFEDEQHQEMLEEHEQVYLADENAARTYSLKDFPLAEPVLIRNLAATHLAFFNLLVKLQDTHTLEDFKIAFQIQDRIAYLLDNQTLLYRGLTKKLIEYLERINKRLREYHEEIVLKQEDIKKINAQISRFNEYDRKTHRKMELAEKETELLKKDAQTYEESLELLSPELREYLMTKEGENIHSKLSDIKKSDNVEKGHTLNSH